MDISPEPFFDAPVRSTPLQHPPADRHAWDPKPTDTTALAAAAALFVIGAGVLVAAARRRAERRPMGVLGAALLLIGAGGGVAVLSAASSTSTPPSYRHWVDVAIGEMGIRWSSPGERTFGGSILNVLADEPLELRFSFWGPNIDKARCRVSSRELGIDAMVGPESYAVVIQRIGTVPARIHVEGPNCPLASGVLSVLPLERADHFLTVSRTNQERYEKRPPRDPLLEGARVIDGTVHVPWCTRCHSLDGSERKAPTFLGLCGSTVPVGGGEYMVADNTYLYAKVERGSRIWKDPRWKGECESSAATIEPADAARIVIYLRSLSPACRRSLEDEEEAKRYYSPKPRAVERHCAPCHLDSSEDAGSPPFVGMFGSAIPLSDGTAALVDEDFIRESIFYRQSDSPSDSRYPRATLHDFAGTLSERDFQMIMSDLRQDAFYQPDAMLRPELVEEFRK